MEGDDSADEIREEVRNLMFELQCSFRSIHDKLELIFDRLSLGPNDATVTVEHVAAAVSQLIHAASVTLAEIPTMILQTDMEDTKPVNVPAPPEDAANIKSMGNQEAIKNSSASVEFKTEAHIKSSVNSFSSIIVPQNRIPVRKRALGLPDFNKLKTLERIMISMKANGEKLENLQNKSFYIGKISGKCSKKKRVQRANVLIRFQGSLCAAPAVEAMLRRHFPKVPEVEINLHQLWAKSVYRVVYEPKQNSLQNVYNQKFSLGTTKSRDEYDFRPRQRPSNRVVNKMTDWSLVPNKSLKHRASE